ncbi:hypothetical protein [Sphingomonas crocodyli]|uniref:Uncharacterized protein n=1 Tax=Sphingomonas crocodyli TaxID=1979270 RepID=A0A437LXS5_9SPHN|nr:hypothetical protein [Sphingomonas crocodyli]RVT90218.1 hypothetical protein EOD43_18140 [Sphingomonas crocodyli]
MSLDDRKSAAELNAFQEGYAAFADGAGSVELFNPYIDEDQEQLYHAWEAGAAYHDREMIHFDTHGCVVWINDHTGRPYQRVD